MSDEPESIKEQVKYVKIGFILHLRDIKWTEYYLFIMQIMQIHLT